MQAVVVACAVQRRHHIVIVAERNECARSVGRYLLFIRKLHLKLGRSILSEKIVMTSHVGVRLIHRNYGIEQNLEVGARRSIVVSSHSRGKMTSADEPMMPMSLGIKVPHLGAVTQHLHGGLGASPTGIL